MFFFSPSPESIKVNIDLAQEPVKLEVVKAKKTLFVPPAQKSPNVYTKVKNCNPDELDVATQKKIVKLQGAEDTFQEIGEWFSCCCHF